MFEKNEGPSNNPEKLRGTNPVPHSAFDGIEIPLIEGKEQHSNFKDRLGDCENLSLFPCAVCYSISELRDFLGKAELSFPDGISQEDQGIALLMGIKNTSDAGHAQNRVTVMLVASAFTEDTADRRVTSISNFILGDRGYGVAVNGKVYDSGSLWP